MAQLAEFKHTIAAQAERLTEFKRIGQGFEHDAQKFFEQSCINLTRAEVAEATTSRLREVLANLIAVVDGSPGAPDTAAAWNAADAALKETK